MNEKASTTALLDETQSKRTYSTKVYSARSATSKLAPGSIQRRHPRPQDIQIEILYCGVCHSDLHTVRNEWESVMPTAYPCVPGHEIVGRVVKAGSAVKKFKEGDLAAVGCLVDSCGVCPSCRAGDEQFCDNMATFTYNSEDKQIGGVTYGGYSQSIVVTEGFALRVPKQLNLAATAPLLCAGITTYSPLRTWNVGPGSRVGVIGLGGLGHMAVKLASGLGAHVAVLSRSHDKQADARALGADELLVSTHKEAMVKAGSSFDLIVDTVPVRHDLNPYLPLLDVDGTLVIVGQVGPLEEPITTPLLLGRRRVAGSPIGGIAETGEMLDFCGRKNILPECEMIRMDAINEAFERMERSDVRYRFVIDMSSLPGRAA